MAWQRSIGARSSKRPRVQIAIYSAVVAYGVETSSLRFNSGLETDELAAAIAIPPDWSLSQWPPQAPDNPDNDLVLKALTKLKALFDFASGLPDGDSEEIRQAVAARFLGSIDQSAATIAQKRFTVEAVIWEDGTATWGYDIPSAGSVPTSVNTATDLDVFVQNLVRSDLQQRIEAISKSQ